MDTSGIMSTVALVISVVGSVIAAINHKRLRSVCCNKPIVISVDIEDTTPHKPSAESAHP